MDKLKGLITWRIKEALARYGLQMLQVFGGFWIFAGPSLWPAQRAELRTSLMNPG